MPSKLRSRLSYANVVSTICLFIVLGGTSYGLATGSIDSREIKNNTVRSKDIRNNTVRSRDVRNFSLFARDFKPGQLPAGPRGLQGPKGDTGPPGTTGAQGIPGVSGLEVRSMMSNRDSSSLKNVTATCSAGKRVIGASGHTTDGTTGLQPNVLADVVIIGIFPTSENAVPGFVTVRAAEEEPTADFWDVTAHAICANVS